MYEQAYPRGVPRVPQDGACARRGSVRGDAEGGGGHQQVPAGILRPGHREQPVPLRAARGVRWMGPVREGDPAGAGGVLPRTGRHAHAPALRRRPELAHPRRLRQAGAQGRVHGQVPGQDHLHELRADRADGRHRRRSAYHRAQGRERQLRAQRREVAHLPHRLLAVRLRHRGDRP